MAEASSSVAGRIRIFAVPRAGVSVEKAPGGGAAGSALLVTAVALADVLVGELLGLLDLLVVLAAGPLVGELLRPLQDVVGALLPLLAVEEPLGLLLQIS